MTQRAETGFTLIEALIAMAVLAIGAVSLLTAVETHSRRIGDVTDRVVARWVAEDHLTALRLGLPVDRDVAMLGRNWTVDTIRDETSDPDLSQITVEVSRNDRLLFAVTGFIDIGANR